MLSIQKILIKSKELQWMMRKEKLEIYQVLRIKIDLVVVSMVLLNKEYV
jgi:hypothetical protein